MVEPLVRCTLVGKKYHNNKQKLKKMFKEHGMNYSGTFAFPIWSGDSEYVRGEFQREYNEQTGEEETKVATLLLYTKKEKKPTQFTREFKKWCKEAEGSIDGADGDGKPKPKDRKSSADDWKRLIAYKFRGSGQRELSKQDIVFGISFDRRWTIPKTANTLIEKAIKMGYLKKKGDKLIPTFDVGGVEYPTSYTPDVGAMEKDAEYTEE
jgi:hypothetical protein